MLLERSLKELASANFPQLAKLNISHHMAQCKENKTLLTIVNDTKLFERSLNSFQNSISIDNIIPDLNRTLRVRMPAYSIFILFLKISVTDRLTGGIDHDVVMSIYL